VRIARIGGLVGTLAILVASALPVASAAGPAALSVVYDDTVYGDFAVIGNTVTQCPREPGHYPVNLCADAQNRIGSGTSAQNNGHAMAWADVDTDPGTYDSSSARLTIPAGAHIAYAKLSWAGDTGGPVGVPCGLGLPKPPGAPRQQVLSMKVNDRASAVKPVRYTEDGPVGLTDHQFYSAYADVTGEFRGVSGPATVTVGNVWTPQGYDCFGGWSLTAVWAFDGPQATASARKQVVVYDGHVRLLTGLFRADAVLPSAKAAGGPARVGITAFEGDWAVSGDQFLINGRNAGGTDNFFVSSADGQLNPSHPNNMSVDARTVDVGPDVVRTGANVTFTSGLDAYLVSGMAVALTRPELVVTTGMSYGTAHPGEDVTQNVQVTNTGAAPAVDVQVHEDLGAACDQHVGQIGPGKSITVSCTRPAREGDYKPTAQATAASMAGDKLTAQASTAVDVIRPAITATKTASPAMVLNGQKVGYAIEVRNTGDTPLSGVSVDDKQVDACDRPDVGVLSAGESQKIECSVVAGDDGFTNTVSVGGTDKLGKRVTSEAHAAFSVVAPKIDFTVRPSTHAARAGQAVTFTIAVKNSSQAPLGSVRVAGTPVECTRAIGGLAAGQEVDYACDVRIQDRLTTALSVTAIPSVDGQVRQETVYATAALIVTLVPPTAPPPLLVSRPVAKKAVVVPVPSPAPIAITIAGLAVISTFVTIGAISATAGRPGK
jgi:CARDB protein